MLCVDIEKMYTLTLYENSRIKMYTVPLTQPNPTQHNLKFTGLTCAAFSGRTYPIVHRDLMYEQKNFSDIQ